MNRHKTMDANKFTKPLLSKIGLYIRAFIAILLTLHAFFPKDFHHFGVEYLGTNHMHYLLPAIAVLVYFATLIKQRFKIHDYFLLVLVIFLMTSDFSLPLSVYTGIIMLGTVILLLNIKFSKDTLLKSKKQHDSIR